MTIHRADGSVAHKRSCPDCREIYPCDCLAADGPDAHPGRCVDTADAEECAALIAAKIFMGVRHYCESAAVVIADSERAETKAQLYELGETMALHVRLCAVCREGRGDVLLGGKIR